MKRHTFVYLFITVFVGLTVVSFVIGSLPSAAAAPSYAPVGLTETFTPPPTNTSVPVATNTPVPAATNTPVPAATNTSVPAPTNTSVPIETNTTVPVATNTPVSAETPTPVGTVTSVPTETEAAPAVVGLPNTGGGAPQSAAPQSAASPWVLVLLAAVIGSLGALVFRLNRRAYRPTRR